ncbi:MAG: hypothetical protein HYY24_13715 [Verrucomicrobia bacterium]|nr:hypothetical protein [Verrucomicrobiota bacterium]
MKKPTRPQKQKRRTNETNPLFLTLAGIGSYLRAARWGTAGDVILASAPWQDWRAPSWEEINSAEAKQKTETGQPWP